MMDKVVSFDKTLFELKRQIELVAGKKMKLEGVDINQLKRRVGRRE